MAGGTIVAICQFGGEFISNDDGTTSYTGGEAHAIDIRRDMPINDFKAEITNMFNIDSSTVSIKYFLPSNKRTLITISSDKDLERMVDFNMGSMTTDIYVSNEVDSRQTTSIVADSGTSIIDTAAVDCNVRSQRITASKKIGKRATRCKISVADSSTPKVNTGSTADNGRQWEPNTAEKSDNRVVAADSVALAISPTIDISRQQILVTGDKVDNRATRSVIAASNNLDLVSVDIAGDIEPQPSSTPWDSVITDVGQEFDNVKSFRDELCKYAYAKGFRYKYIKNDHERVTVRCAVESCPWRIHASGSARKQKFMIKKINNVHMCGAGTGDDGRRRTTKHWLASIIKDKLLDNPESKTRDIARDLYRDYGINLNYTQAWHAKEVAQKELHLLHEEACNQLPWLCEKIIETNPGSVATLTTSVDSKIRRLFVSFHASLHGFQHGCRPLLFLDRIPLKANNNWKLLAAAAVDGDDDIFPVAFAAVEAETRDSWQWFLVQLKCAVSASLNITIISSRQMRLDESVPQVFEDGYHGFCLFHLIGDFKAELKNSLWTEQVKDEMVEDFKSAAQAYGVEDFNASIDRINNVSEDAADWVISTKPERWSNAFFRGSRYDHLSSNIVESLSRWITVKDESSVVQMIDALRIKLTEVINSRRQTCSTWVSTLTPSMEQKLQKQTSKAHTLNVLCSSDTLFEVHGSTINVVNIGSWECTCRKWQITGLPCAHAIAVFDRVGKSVYDYCSRYFRSESYLLTYSASIYPIPDIVNMNSIGASSYPPPTKRPPGRPKRKRINPYKTSIRPLHCSRCKVAGHNKATCEAQL